MQKVYIAAIVLLILSLASWGTWEFSKARSMQLFGEIITSVETSRKEVALTFDDGPSPDATDRILTILRNHGVKATFFLIGADLEKYPDLGRAIAGDGHEIGNHSYSHTRMVLKSMSFVRGEVERTDELIRKTGYGGPIHFRAPFCKKLVALPLYLSRTGRKMITWDIEPETYPEIGSSSDRIEAHVLERVKPGSIILLHVMYKSRMQSLMAVDGIISKLKNRGYEFKTVSELIKHI